jgi:DNA-binding transcriptional MerR regulator
LTLYLDTGFILVFRSWRDAQMALTMGQVAAAADVNIQTIRYHERRGLFAAPRRTPSGYRTYATDPVSRLRFIKHAQELGFSLKEIQELLGLRVTEDQARTEGIAPLVSKVPLEHVPRALAARDTRGFVKLVADGATRKIIGAHILAAEAGEMITEPALAIKVGLTIEDLTSTFHPYLTLSEAIRLAAQTFTKDVANLSCCAA